MGIVIATCGHQLADGEGIGEPFWLFDDGELSWLVFCSACRAKLTPVYVYDPFTLSKAVTSDHG